VHEAQNDEIAVPTTQYGFSADPSKFGQHNSGFEESVNLRSNGLLSNIPTGTEVMAL